jgi:hypothetical protein
MSDTEHQNLRERARELRPDAIWFLLAFIGSAVAAGIVGWIPDPSLRAVVIGICLFMNALLIAWLSWLRTRDNKANTRELTTLVQRIEKLRKASRVISQQRQQREPPRQQISGFENSRPDVVDRPSRTEFGDLTTSPRWSVGENGRWSVGEQDAYKQWTRLNAAEKAIVRFVLLRGTATAARLLQFRDPEGSRSTDTCDGVRQKTSFLLGDLESGLTINPQLKPYLENIILQDESRRARF